MQGIAGGLAFALPAGFAFLYVLLSEYAGFHSLLVFSWRGFAQLDYANTVKRARPRSVVSPWRCFKAVPTWAQCGSNAVSYLLLARIQTMGSVDVSNRLGFIGAVRDGMRLPL